MIFNGDDLWGAYASVNFGSKWNVLANYEHVNLLDKTKYSEDDSADVWIGKLTYGKASMAQPKSWDIWVEYIDAEDGAFLGGSTNSWRFGNYMDNLTSWGAGIDYVVAKNAMFSVMQSFATDTKDGDFSNKDREQEQTRAQFQFALIYPFLENKTRRLRQRRAFICIVIFPEFSIVNVRR